MCQQIMKICIVIDVLKMKLMFEWIAHFNGKCFSSFTFLNSQSLLILFSQGILCLSQCQVSLWNSWEFVCPCFILYVGYGRKRDLVFYLGVNDFFIINTLFLFSISLLHHNFSLNLIITVILMVWKFLRMFYSTIP